ncbi:hypothetical protein [Bdellovibrio bacteriovorus]|uniref:hypothetical protein n=1 Tax=Bdellovibrio bacteriovorus TaxID=959 RepID=UPI0005A07801|nr:hypothetical protein [Bdellovibrio bacteriovorus]
MKKFILLFSGLAISMGLIYFLKDSDHTDNMPTAKPISLPRTTRLKFESVVAAVTPASQPTQQSNRADEIEESKKSTMTRLIAEHYLRMDNLARHLEQAARSKYSNWGEQDVRSAIENFEKTEHPSYQELNVHYRHLIEALEYSQIRPSKKGAYAEKLGAIYSVLYDETVDAAPLYYQVRTEDYGDHMKIWLEL